jgi:hypothetical protein
MERDEFTLQMWRQLPAAIHETMSLETVQLQWWHDSRADGGWRLSWTGLVDLTDVLHIESWDFDFATREIQPWMLLKLKKNVSVPYYITDNRKHTRITVLDSKQAVMINLYGQVEKWIKSLV